MKEKHVKSSRRKYDATFKKEVLQMVESGRPVSDVARSLGVGENLLYRWKSRSKSKAADSHQTNIPALDPEKLVLEFYLQGLFCNDVFKALVFHFKLPEGRIYGFVVWLQALHAPCPS